MQEIMEQMNTLRPITHTHTKKDQSLVEWVHKLHFLNYTGKGMVTVTWRDLFAT